MISIFAYHFPCLVYTSDEYYSHFTLEGKVRQRISYNSVVSDSGQNVLHIGISEDQSPSGLSLIHIFSMDGQQTFNYKAQNFGQLPIEKVMQPAGKQLVIHVPYADSFVVHANVWKASVGRIPFICWIRTMNSTASLTALSLTICMEVTGRIG